MVTQPFVTVKSVRASPVTFSAKVIVIGIGYVEVGLDRLVFRVPFGLVVSITIALFAANDPAAPGLGKVNTASFPAASLNVPVSAVVEM